ncbi:type I restriction enzyme HsdR protein N-terminal domain protein [Mycoplasmopsis alligatoris A21JP2]|uniref:type I site-specific deoxyribonuclease n=1 Tax=Mycoplasmopsis alligatoris A21JP2 TaxID=747682 RepID=D4XVA0_9BACT|nr:type I restriction enzyme HsdR protein N-terminal domain protein [Mycoplasmopsis alligatoris A21JP2]
MKKEVTIAEQNEITVIAQFESSKIIETEYQTEIKLEEKFINQLVSQGYIYEKNIKDEKSLLNNCKKQIEKLNNFVFSDDEWEIFKKEYLFNASSFLIGQASNEITNFSLTSLKTHLIQKHHIYTLKRELNNSKINIKIIDKKNIHNNNLQVINQYEVTNNKSNRKNRYDVTILVNGLPLVHI